MSNRSARRAARNEMRVTPRKLTLLLAGGASLAGLALGVSVLSGSVSPDEASAVATVSSATTAVVTLLLRREATPTSDGTGPVALDK